MIKVEIIRDPVKLFAINDDRKEDGAELVFNGRVRNMERGKEIIALEYEQYEGMAELELKEIAQRTCKKFPIKDLFCRHRIGIINVGEISLHVVIWSKHRREGLEAMNWFISELKKHVPIWKWAIMIDNTRVPSECEH
tara:strand:- start:3632 stop:4045 length:414 start_codon:yes stop_codon:yes gene_type:complete